MLQNTLLKKLFAKCGIIIIAPAILFLEVSCSNDESARDTRIPLAEYSKDNAREWESIKDEHIPQVNRFRDNASAEFLKITVPLKNPSPSHYIEVIGIMDDKKQTLQSVTFRRDQKVFSATISIDPTWDMKTAKVYAKCNLHDTWVVTDLHLLQ